MKAFVGINLGACIKLTLLGTILCLIACNFLNKPDADQIKRELTVAVGIENASGSGYNVIGEGTCYIQKTETVLSVMLSSFKRRIDGLESTQFPGPTSIFSESISSRHQSELFRFPLSVGQTWGTTGMWDSQIQTTIEDYETVEIGIGTFLKCLKHKVVFTGAEADTELEKVLFNGTRYLWFAKGVGLIKMRYEHSNGVITEAELIDYGVPGKSKAYFPLDIGARWKYRWQNDYSDGPIIEIIQIDEVGKVHQMPLEDARYVVKINAEEPGDIDVRCTLTPENPNVEHIKLRLDGDSAYVYAVIPNGFAWRDDVYTSDYDHAMWRFKYFHRNLPKLPFVFNYKVSLKEAKRTWELYKGKWVKKQYPTRVPDVREDCIRWHSSLLFLVGGDCRNIEVEFELPEGWRVSTPWQRIGNTGHRFVVKDQDELIDSRLLIGQHLETVVKSGKTEVMLAISGSLKAHEDVMSDTVGKFLHAYSRVFKGGSKERVLFILNPHLEKRAKRLLKGHGSGRSVSILMDLTLDDATKYEWEPFLGHEVFHIWNGLTALQNFSNREHWFKEGVTNYYSDITATRLGYLSEREFLDRLERVCESYLSAPNKFAIGDFRDSRLSYEGGSLVAVALDLEIRDHKRNGKSLDHVMQQMYRRFGDTTVEYTQRDIIRTVNKVAGKDFEPFFQTYIVGKERLPLAEYFDKAGLNVQVNSEKLPTADYVEEVLKASLGRDTGVEVTSINGSRIGSLKELRKIAKHWKSGEAVTLSFEENGKPVTVTATLKGISDNPPTESEIVVRITKQAKPTKLQRAILAGILDKR